MGDHPAVSSDSTVTVSWYKGTDFLSSESFGSDDDVESTYELSGTWGDSSYYRCLFQYSDPYIPPIYSQKMNIAYVGIYRTSMFRFETAGDGDGQLTLTKIASEDFQAYVYIQVGGELVQQVLSRSSIPLRWVVAAVTT